MAEKYDSLHRAMIDFGIPFENRELIQQMCTWIGIAFLVVGKQYIRAVRVDSQKPAL